MERERERELAGDLSSSVPVIDISRLGKDPAVAKQIVEAAEWPGFFHITGHGIDEVIGPLRETSAYLFTKTSKEALESAKRDPQNSRGYFDDELTKQKRDWKRCLDVDGENRWPPEPAAPGLRAAIEAFVPDATKVALRLLSVLVSAVGLSEDEAADYVEALAASHTSFLRLNYYPPCPDPAANKGIERHTDAGLLTLLLHDDVEALQVRVPPRPSSHQRPPADGSASASTSTAAVAATAPGASWALPNGNDAAASTSASAQQQDPTAAAADERWEFVRPVPGAFTVNVGDMLTVLSNGRFPAPEHRVLANTSAERRSWAYFLNPGYDDTIAPLASPPRFQRVLWAEFRRRRYEGDVRDVGEETQIAHYALGEGGAA